MKNFSTNTFILGISLGLELAGCASSSHPNKERASCPVKPTISAAPIPVKPPEDKPAKPHTEAEFYANLISCEATTNAHVGYLRSLQLRFKMSALNTADLPCNIIQDIDHNLKRVSEKCSAVIEPEGLHFNPDPVERLNQSRLSADAQEISQAARQASQKIHQSEKRCFPEEKIFTSL